MKYNDMITFGIIALLVGVLAFGQSATVEQNDWTPIIATEAAYATMSGSVTPTPIPPDNKYKCKFCKDTGIITHGDGHTTPCPHCNAGDSPQGWILSDAKALIAKGNKLADRGKLILDQAERDGKITVDVHLPKPTTQAGTWQCDGNVCRLVPNVEATVPTETTQKNQPVYRRRGFFRRWR